MDAFRTLMFRYYKTERDRADKCMSDIVDIVNSGETPGMTLDEIEGRIMAYYDRTAWPLLDLDGEIGHK